jgi:hypothetical protein
MSVPSQPAGDLEADEGQTNTPISDLTRADWRAILAEYDHCCAYCGARDVPLHQKHMTPP